MTNLTYNIDFSIAALCFLAIYYFFLKYSYSTGSIGNKIFRNLVVVVFFADLLDVVTAVTISNAENIPLWINYVLNMLFFMLTIMPSFLVLGYVCVIAGEGRGKVNKSGRAVSFFIILLYDILVASSPYTRIIFYFNENYEYVHGKGYFIMYAITTYFLVIAIIKLALERKTLGLRRTLPVLFFVLILTTGVILQAVLFKETLLTYFIASIASFVILFSLETPDYVQLTNTVELLQSKQKEAENAILVKDNFVRGVTESLRGVFAQIVSGDITDVEFIRELVSDADSTIEDVADVAMMESTNFSVQNENFSLIELINDIESEFTDFSLGVKFSVNFCQNLPNILYGDYGKIKEAVRKLIKEGYRYTKRGEISVMFDGEWLDETKATVRVSVCDNGEKRDAEASDEAIRRNKLKLDIVKKLAELINGEFSSEISAGLNTYTISGVFDVVENKPIFMYDVLPTQKEEKRSLPDCINEKMGLENCNNDESFFREMLSVFVNTVRTGELDEAFNGENFEDYRIVVHSIKSAARIIGAKDLSEFALSLEDACKAGDLRYVKGYAELFREQYLGVMEDVRKYIEI